jgi:hypothetical protein
MGLTHKKLEISQNSDLWIAGRAFWRPSSQHIPTQSNIIQQEHSTEVFTIVLESSRTKKNIVTIVLFIALSTMCHALSGIPSLLDKENWVKKILVYFSRVELSAHVSA